MRKPGAGTLEPTTFSVLFAEQSLLHRLLKQTLLKRNCSRRLLVRIFEWEVRHHDFNYPMAFPRMYGRNSTSLLQTLLTNLEINSVQFSNWLAYIQEVHPAEGGQDLEAAMTGSVLLGEDDEEPCHPPTAAKIYYEPVLFSVQ